MLGKVVVVLKLKNTNSDKLAKELAKRVPTVRFGRWSSLDYVLEMTNIFDEETKHISLMAPKLGDNITLFTVDVTSLSGTGELPYYATEDVPPETKAVIDISLRPAVYKDSKISYFAKNIGLNPDNSLQTLKVCQFSYTTAVFISNQQQLDAAVEKIATGLKRGTIYDCARALIDTKMGSAPVCQQCPEQLSCLAMASTHVRGYEK